MITIKVLFAHNIRIKKDSNNQLYTHSSYNQEVWDRYKTIGDQINILARKDTSVYDSHEAEDKFEEFDTDNMGIIYIEDIHQSIPKYLNPIIRKDNNSIIENAVINHDYLVARLPSYAGFKSIEYARKHGVPYLCEVVACPWDGLWNHSLKGKALAPSTYLKLKSVVKDAPYVIYVTNSFLQNRYPTQGKQIGVSDVVLEKTSDEILNTRINKIDSTKKNDKIIIGTTAAIDVKFKGQQYVIQALRRLKEEGFTNFEYQIVGGGDPSFLTDIAKRNNVINQVKFMGSLPHDEVFTWLDSIDIYIQPSKQEGLPRALVEAMSRGLPALGARTGGIPELIDEECIFENKTNVEEIAGLLKNLNKENLNYYAKRNFSKSKEYNKELLNNKREKFLVDFQKYSKLN